MRQTGIRYISLWIGESCRRARELAPSQAMSKRPVVLDLSSNVAVTESRSLSNLDNDFPPLLITKLEELRLECLAVGEREALFLTHLDIDACGKECP